MHKVLVFIPNKLIKRNIYNLESDMVAHIFRRIEYSKPP